MTVKVKFHPILNTQPYNNYILIDCRYLVIGGFLDLANKKQ